MQPRVFRAASGGTPAVLLPPLIQLISCLAVATAASLQLHSTGSRGPSRDSNRTWGDGATKLQTDKDAASSHSNPVLTKQETWNHTNHGHFPVHNTQATSDNLHSNGLHRNLSFVLGKPGVCSSDTFLVIVVCSSAENFRQRAAIRATWGGATNHPHGGARVVFLLGLPSQTQFHENAQHIQTEIRKEDSQFSDIIQSNFDDSYRNLSLKSVAMLQWVNSHCGSARFLLKTDDDVFINIKTLLSDLHNIVHRRFIMGNIIAGAEPIQDPTSKWYTPKTLYPGARYPKYISGTAYVISGDLISDLFMVARDSALFLWEDVYVTGMCAQKLDDVTHVFNAKFGYKKRISDACLFRMLITGHRMSPEELRALWSRVNDPQLTCSSPT